MKAGGGIENQRLIPFNELLIKILHPVSLFVTCLNKIAVPVVVESVVVLVVVPARFATEIADIDTHSPVVRNPPAAFVHPSIPAVQPSASRLNSPEAAAEASC